MSFLLPIKHRTLRPSVKRVSVMFDIEISERYLFTEESLRIPSFRQTCKNILSSVENPSEFKEEMKEKCKKKYGSLMFLENLKQMIGITRDDNDLALLKQMMLKYSSQVDLIRFGSYKFGPEVMRLYFILNKPQEALDIYNNPDLIKHFSEHTTFVLLAELLFKNGMCEEVLNLCENFIKRLVTGRKYPTNVIVVYFTACYKVNTPESLDKASSMWKDILENHCFCPLRGVLLYATLAFKHNKLDLALSVSSTIKKRAALQINLKLLILAKKGCYQEVINFINEIYFTDSPEVNCNNFVIEEVLLIVEKEFQNAPEEDFIKFKALKENLSAHNFIKEGTFDKYLLEKINYGSSNKSDIKPKTL